MKIITPLHVLPRVFYSLIHSNIGSWIVDSGASDHICSSIRLFGAYQQIMLLNIKLPNGHMPIAKYPGTLKFSLGLVAQNVLSVPDFKLNLLLVPKLYVDIDCTVTFNNDKRLI